ncbi:MAG: hypothetical protein QW303_01985 [Nitrososphaerota archaeon]
MGLAPWVKSAYAILEKDENLGYKILDHNRFKFRLETVHRQGKHRTEVRPDIFSISQQLEGIIEKYRPGVIIKGISKYYKQEYSVLRRTALLAGFFEGYCRALKTKVVFVLPTSLRYWTWDQFGVEPTSDAARSIFKITSAKLTDEEAEAIFLAAVGGAHDHLWI